MPGFRRSRHLTCFYCGRKTSTLNDGTVRHFECPSCTATNYLDKNGEITDPPVAATKAAPAAARYAHPGTAPAADAAADEIFCPTCLKNQHLFTASLAQYLPDDPSHPDYAELERGYYKFRRGLEQRYPQACADCAPKVLARIRQADYTAKTDHLRRMIDQSRAGRSRNRSALEIVDAVAGRLWQAGLVLQLLWQLSHLSILLPDQTFADESRPARILVGTLRPLLERLPEGSKLLEWSVSASVLSCWWNPRLPQTVRGFTKHIVGLGNWYAYQAITVLIRLGLWQFCRLSLHDAPALAILSVHLFVALASIGIYTVAPRSVRTDTTPLFGHVPSSLPTSPAGPKAQADDRATMSDILDEILVSPSGAPDRSFGGHHTASTPDDHRYSRSSRPGSGGSLRYSSTATGGGPNPFASGDPTRQGEAFRLGSLVISEEDNSTLPSRQTSVGYDDDEMDWSPTQSRHRAFNTYDAGGSHAAGFGQTPVGADRGQFWYKVPPAPSSLAQRVRNPPNAPRLRQSPIAKDDLSFRHANGYTARAPVGSGAAEEPAGVEFTESSFFVPEQNNDPRNSLSDLFGQSFSLTSQQEGVGGRGTAPTRGWLHLRRKSSLFPVRSAEVLVLAVSLAAWLHAAATQHGYTAEVMLAAIVACNLTSSSLVSSSLRKPHEGRPLALVFSRVSIVLAGVELVLSTQLALQIWLRGGAVLLGGYETWFIFTIVAHQLVTSTLLV